MATSKRSGRSGFSSTFGTALPAEISRYDLVLAVIPSAFLVAGLLGTVFSLSVEITAFLGSVIAMLAIVDGLFVNPPGDDG